jgi:enamine deaminase RidA (YjgF/YER057c/UK114 family)
MVKTLVSSGSPFEKAAGYSRAVAVMLDNQHWCMVSGTTGYDYDTMAMPETIEEQTRNCIATIENALKKAGFSLNDVVRIRYYLSDVKDKDAVFAIAGETFGDIRPAATMVIAGLIETEMKIEIEVTACKA